MDSYLFIQLSFNWALWKLDLVIAKKEKKMSEYLEVAKILAVRSIDGRKEYRVRWKDFRSKDDAWVLEKDSQIEWNELKSQDRQKTLS